MSKNSISGNLIERFWESIQSIESKLSESVIISTRYIKKYRTIYRTQTTRNKVPASKITRNGWTIILREIKNDQEVATNESTKSLRAITPNIPIKKEYIKQIEIMEIIQFNASKHVQEAGR